jgi:hypothetical protein
VRERIATLATPLEWIYLAAGIALVLRYLWLIDDAFIYYRYLDNLLFLDLGLVFNQGEFVEGYSSPFWILFLIPWRAAGLDYWSVTKIVAVGGFALFWLLLVRLNRRLSPAGPVVNAPLAYLTFCYGVSCYFSSGIETPFVQLAAVVYALYILEPRSRTWETALALSPLVRHELAVPFVLCAIWGGIRRRAVPWRLLVQATLFVGGWLAFRIYTYADLFPNTFYLKNSTDPLQGLVYLHQTATTYHVVPLVVLFAGVAILLHRHGSGAFRADAAARWMMIACALSVTLYVVKIGGDPRHYRYLAFPFVLLACAGAGIAEHALALLPQRTSRVAAPVASLVLAALALSSYPPQLDRHPITHAENHRRVDKIHDASWHRHLPELSFRADRRAADRARRTAYRRAARDFHSKGVRTFNMCVTAYWLYETYAIHELGLTDAILARTNARDDLPAHKYSLRPRARDLAIAHRAATKAGRGMYRELVESGRAPAWIADNLASIETIERKIYNRHDWRENLRLALTFPPRIRIPDWRDDPNGEVDPAEIQSTQTRDNRDAARTPRSSESGETE